MTPRRAAAHYFSPGFLPAEPGAMSACDPRAEEGISFAGFVQKSQSDDAATPGYGIYIRSRRETQAPTTAGIPLWRLRRTIHRDEWPPKGGLVLLSAAQLVMQNTCHAANPIHPSIQLDGSNPSNPSKNPIIQLSIQSNLPNWKSNESLILVLIY